jgi:hypothetical protein
MMDPSKLLVTSLISAALLSSVLIVGIFDPLNVYAANGEDTTFDSYAQYEGGFVDKAFG